MKKIYLAGFDVFYPDSVERGKRLKKLCEKYGFIGLYPLDNECDTAEEIFSANTEMIKNSDSLSLVKFSNITVLANFAVLFDNNGLISISYSPQSPAKLTTRL